MKNYKYFIDKLIFAVYSIQNTCNLKFDNLIYLVIKTYQGRYNFEIWQEMRTQNKRKIPGNGNLCFYYRKKSHYNINLQFK